MRNALYRLTSAIALLAFALTGQQSGVRNLGSFPPDIFDNRSVDAARIAPDRCVIEIDNERMRVLRMKVPALNRVPIHGHRSGVIIALTELRLRLTAPDGAVIDVRLPAGDMRWIDAGIHAEENLGAAAAEYLFIESKG